jgi:hypothetical protein
MDTVHSCKTLVIVYQTTLLHILEDSTFHNHHRERPRTNNFKYQFKISHVLLTGGLGGILHAKLHRKKNALCEVMSIHLSIFDLV